MADHEKKHLATHEPSSVDCLDLKNCNEYVQEDIRTEYLLSAA